MINFVSLIENVQILGKIYLNKHKIPAKLVEVNSDTL